jgi:hypothetical protein
MPKPGYVSLNVKEEDAERLEEFAKKNNLTIVAFAHILAENLPNVDGQTLAYLLKNASKLKLQFSIDEEVLKHCLASLYYYFQAMHSLVSSLFPPAFIDLKIFRVLKVWEDEVLPYTALHIAGLLDVSVDTFQLLRELENVEKALEKILDKNWHDWKEINPPLLLKEIPLPKSLLKPNMIAKPEAIETLKNEVKPYLQTIAQICQKAEDTLYSISADYPGILELCNPPLQNFKKLFKV